MSLFQVPKQNRHQYCNLNLFSEVYPFPLIRILPPEELPLAFNVEFLIQFLYIKDNHLDTEFPTAYPVPSFPPINLISPPLVTIPPSAIAILPSESPSLSAHRITLPPFKVKVEVNVMLSSDFSVREAEFKLDLEISFEILRYYKPVKQR